MILDDTWFTMMTLTTMTMIMAMRYLRKSTRSRTTNCYLSSPNCFKSSLVRLMMIRIIIVMLMMMIERIVITITMIACCTAAVGRERTGLAGWATFTK